MLDWNNVDTAPGRKRLALVRELLAIRRREIVPRLVAAKFGEAHATHNGLVTANWRMGDGTILSLVANLSDRDISHTSAGAGGTLIWGNELKGTMPPPLMKPWAVSWRIG